MDSLKFYLNADELRENRLKSVFRMIEESIISRNLKGNTNLWIDGKYFADFPMGIFEEKLKERGFRVSYRNSDIRDVMGKKHGEERTMVIEWD